MADAVTNTERRARVERLVMSCEEAMKKAFAKNDQLLELAKKTTDPSSVSADLEKWLQDITVSNDEIVQTAREYLDEHRQTETLCKKSTSERKKSSQASSSKLSKSSRQRQRDVFIAQHKREEIEKQNEAALRLAKRKQELELELKKIVNDLQKHIL